MFSLFATRASIEVRKVARLRQLDNELQGLYMVGALCTSDAVLENVTRQVIRVEHNIERVRRTGLKAKPAAEGSLLHRLRRRLGLVLIGVGAGLTSRAQGYGEGLSASYEYLPLHFKGTEQPTFHGDVYRASAILPVAPAPDSSHSFLAGASVELLRFGSPRPGFPVGTVYGLSPVLGYRQWVSPQLELMALVLPALNSDLRQVRGEDVRLGGVVRGVYRVSPRLAYRATVGYRSQFYGPQYVLLLGLDWQPSGRWRVFGDLPTSLTASYALSPRTATGFVLTGINTAYRLQEGNRYFQYQQAHYGLFAEHYATAHWVVRATVAYALTRRLDVYDQNQQWPATLDYIGLGKAPIPVSEPLSKGLAVKVALSYRVPQRN